MSTIDRLQATLAGRYTIEREIGRGGMATVYLARDVKHERQVAVKVLDPELGAVVGAERFLAEIRVTANLQHPNLLPLFDSGEADGLLFYVMPFVEGESLRALLDREKQLPVDDALRIAVAVANALDYAHQHGVIHRDLKPENILMQHGQPVIADFGIALAVSKAGGGRITQTGLSLGTPQYMSPEQATGDRGIDGRTDIYSLAAILYEMLAGEPPHLGTSSQAIIAKLMTESPRPVTVLRPTVPPSVSAAVQHALQKLPADRFATAKEFAAALSNPGVFTERSLAASAGEPSVATPARSSRLVAPLAAIAVGAVAVAGWALSRPAPEARVTRTLMEFPDSLVPLPGSPFVLSRDGNQLAYVAPASGGGRQVMIKARGNAFATALPSTAGDGTIGTSLAFSPDGQQLAYVSGSGLRVVSTRGGATQLLADTVSSGRGLAWLEDGSIVFVRADGYTMARVTRDGGPATGLSTSDSGFVLVRSPLPEARGVLYVQCSGANCVRDLSLWALDARTGERTRLVSDAARGWVLPSGQLLYVRPDGIMFVVPFDLKALAVTGDPVRVLDDIAVVNRFTAPVDVSDDGTVVLRTGRTTMQGALFTLTWVDRSGADVPLDTSWQFVLTLGGGNAGWSISPDGRRVAIGLNTDAGDDIWVKQLPIGPLSRLSFDTATEARPRWTRDGRRVVFTSLLNNGTPSSRVGLLMRNADGSGQDSVVVPYRPLGVFEHAFSPDGGSLVVRMGGTTGVVGARDISIIRTAGDTTPRPLLASPRYDESAFALSPDGKWIAFESNETGAVEVYLRPFPDVDGGKWQVSIGGGRAPLWNRNGRELFYVNAGREMVVAPVAPTAGSPGIGERRTLFRMKDEWYLAERENYTPFDISPDGQRFLMARVVRAASAQLAPVLMIENWFTELRAKTGKR